jgi:DNA-directed RNA polymerase specialized sigma24 family protein
MLKKIRPLRDEDDRWISYGLSYEVLKRCARLGKFAEFAYVHRACLNAHIKYIKNEETWGFKPLDDIIHAEHTRWGDIDLRLDLEGVLQPFDQKDAEICRLYLIDEMTFEEIGAKVGLHASSVHRRFMKILPAVRRVAEDYVGPNSPDPTPKIDDLAEAA